MVFLFDMRRTKLNQKYPSLDSDFILLEAKLRNALILF